MDDGQAAAPERVLITWQARIRVLTNPDVWASILMAFGIPGILLGVLVAMIAKRPEFALLVPAVLVSVLLGIFIVVALIIDLFGGFRVTFLVTTDGVRSVSGKGAKAASTAATAAGLLAANAAVAGAGLLAKSEQDVFIAWKAITKIKVRPGRRFVMIRAGWGDKPIGLYCTPENFPQVLDNLRQYAGAALPDSWRLAFEGARPVPASAAP